MTQRAWYYLNEAMTIPAGTPVATPVILPIPTGDIWLENIRYYVPPGNSLLAGWYLAMGNIPILPWGGNFAWFVEDNTYDTLEVQDEFQGNLNFVAYNLDVYSHTVALRIKFQFISTIGQQAETLAVISSSDVSEPDSTPAIAPPDDGVSPNADGSCPIGYQQDPGGSGSCTPIPAAASDDVAMVSSDNLST